MNFITFLEVNGLKQKDLAQFLGVSEPSVSSYVSGKSVPSPDKLKKIIDNPAWDTSALTEDSPLNDPLIEITKLKSLIKSLNEQNARLEEQNARYWALIEKLTSK